MVEELICKRCGKEFHGIIHHIVTCGCAFWKGEKKLTEKVKENDKIKI